MPVKLLQASGLHVTYWRHSGESGGPIYHQYPPFFYSELRNFAVLSSPRKSALGFRSPDPEDVKGKLSRRWGINIRLQQAKPGRGGFLINSTKKRLLAIEGRYHVLVYLHFIYPSRSVYPRFPVCNNKSDVRGQKKQKNKTNHKSPSSSSRLNMQRPERLAKNTVFQKPDYHYY